MTACLVRVLACLVEAGRRLRRGTPGADESERKTEGVLLTSLTLICALERDVIKRRSVSRGNRGSHERAAVTAPTQKSHMTPDFGFPRPTTTEHQLFKIYLERTKRLVRLYFMTCY